MVINKQKMVFSILKKYGYLTTLQICDYMYLIFGVTCCENTARTYRIEYEKKYVDLVAEVGTRKKMNEPQTKHYAGNGKKFMQEAFKTPFFYAVRMFFKNSTIKLHKEIFENS